MHQNSFLTSDACLITIPVSKVNGIKYQSLARNTLNENTGMPELTAQMNIQNRCNSNMTIRGLLRKAFGSIAFWKNNKDNVTSIRPAMSGSVGRSVANPLGK